MTAIRSLKRYPSLEKWSGAASDDCVNCRSLAQEVWGPASKEPGGGLLAFPYLYRRFGPPPFVGDPHKDLAQWILSTGDPAVRLTVRPSGSQLGLCVSYWARRELLDAIRRPRQEWEQACLLWIAEQVAAEHPEWVTARDDKGEPVEMAEAGWEMAGARRWEFGPGSWTEQAIAVIGDPPAGPSRDQWREGPPERVRIHEALSRAMRSLLHPVRVRDVPITVFGRVQP